MDSDFVNQVIIDNEFVTNILAELFAYEIFIEALELGLKQVNVEYAYSDVHCEFPNSNHKEIYNKAEKILLEKYNIEINLDYMEG